MSNYLTIPAPVYLADKIKGAILPRTMYDLLSGHLVDSTSGEILSRKYFDLEGSSLHLNFDMGSIEIPETGEICHVSGAIPLLAQWHCPTVGHTPILRNNHKNEEHEIFAHLAKFDFQEMQNLAQKVKYVHLLVKASVPPDFEISHQNLLPVVYGNIFGFVIDDIFDNLKNSGVQDGNVLIAMSKICSGNTSNGYGSLGINPEICKFLVDCKRKFEQMEKFAGESGPAIESTTEWLRTEGEALFESGIYKTIPAYLSERSYTSAFRCSCEVMALALHINITLEQRRDPVFKRMQDVWATLGGLMNDVYSLPKDVRNRDKSNYLIILSQTENKAIFPCLKDLLEETMPKMVQEIRFLQQQLLHKFGMDEALENYFKVVNNIYDATAKWAPMSGRYGHCKGVKMVFVK